MASPPFELPLSPTTSAPNVPPPTVDNTVLNTDAHLPHDQNTPQDLRQQQEQQRMPPPSYTTTPTATPQSSPQRWLRPPTSPVVGGSPGKRPRVGGAPRPLSVDELARRARIVINQVEQNKERVATDVNTMCTSILEEITKVVTEKKDVLLQELTENTETCYESINRLDFMTCNAKQKLMFNKTRFLSLVAQAFDEIYVHHGTPFSELPEAALRIIAGFLDDASLKSCLKVCRSLREAANRIICQALTGVLTLSNVGMAFADASTIITVKAPPEEKVEFFALAKPQERKLYVYICRPKKLFVCAKRLHFQVLVDNIDTGIQNSCVLYKSDVEELYTNLEKGRGAALSPTTAMDFTLLDTIQVRYTITNTATKTQDTLVDPTKAEPRVWYQPNPAGEDDYF
ncbi:hypothetical protein Pelo_1574 [Pelomyxa schiedti]|nr:hypothetical protein Pelo_1574 [Pelomyxa schiedti]